MQVDKIEKSAATWNEGVCVGLIIPKRPKPKFGIESVAAVLT
jgi:hypothetical protein